MGRNQGECWTELGEIMEYAHKVKVSEEVYEYGGPPLISNGKEMYNCHGEEHSLTIGTTGCGKTRGICMQTVRSLIRADESLIVVDVKGELCNNSYMEAKKRGYELVVLDFRELLKSITWNPLWFPYTLYKSGDPEKVNQAMEMIVDLGTNLYDYQTKDPFWTKSAKNIFVACVEALFIVGEAEQINLFNVYYLFVKGGEKFATSTYLKEFFMTCIGENHPAYVNMSTYLNSPNDTRGGLEAVMLEGIQNFAMSELMKDTLSHNGFDISKLTNKKTAIFILVQDESVKYHKLAGIFVSQVYQHYIRMAHEKHGGKLPRRVNFILEEFGNLRIPEAPSMLSAARSRNIRLHLIIQTLSQLRVHYGTENADVIKSNCLLWYSFSTNNLETLEYLSRLCGERQVNTGEGRREPLISVAQLQRFEPRQALVRIRGKQYVTTFPDISKYDYGETKPYIKKKRKLKEVRLFEIQEYTKIRKRSKLFQALEKQKAESDKNNNKEENDEFTPNINTDGQMASLENYFQKLDEVVI